MKNMIKFPAFVLGLLLLLTGINQKVMAQDENISLQTFYDELSPYGTWIQDDQYGYVWRPDVDQSEFRPYYTNGHWAMTEYGNTWVSDYDWGWAPFHYGRWVTDRYNEWLWIPDTTWGPAWVNWRSGGGNYGWAPLGPSLSVGVSFNIPSFWWVFIPQSNIYYDRFPRYNYSRNYGYIRNTTIINNVYVHNRNTYYTGPRRDEIRRVTNRDVRVYNINRTDRPGRSRIDNNTINIYNPRPSRGSDNRNAAPRNVTDRGQYAGTRGRDNNNNNNNVPNRNPNNGGNRDNNNGNWNGDRNGNSNSSRNGNGNSWNNNPRNSGTNAKPDRDNNHMERPQGSRDNVGAVGQRPDFGNRAPRDGSQADQSRNQGLQQRQQSDQQRQQSDQQRQQSDQRQLQADQQRQQQAQQRQQQSDQQRQQADQQRQQQAQQRQQQAEQRSQEQNNQRQQQMQQRQQAPSAPQRVERPASPQRTETRSNSGGDASRGGGGGGRPGRGGGRG
jgi:DNA segregation ATPase FtsK/SpoIIIE-like protein